jgi:hypothetical protein
MKGIMKKNSLDSSFILQKSGGVHEVRGPEALRERAVNGRKRGAGLVAAALPLTRPPAWPGPTITAI